ncbi:phage tail protein, partial [Methylorubrum salsuginis]
MEAFVGTILPVAFDFPPQGWLLCNGALLNINQYNALYALLGTRYGGNGTTTFALPNLQGRVPINQGQLAGGANYPIGSAGGVETVTLNTQQMPLHTHAMTVDGSPGKTSVPSGNYFAQTQ